MIYAFLYFGLCIIIPPRYRHPASLAGEHAGSWRCWRRWCWWWWWEGYKELVKWRGMPLREGRVSMMLSVTSLALWLELGCPFSSCRCCQKRQKYEKTPHLFSPFADFWDSFFERNYAALSQFFSFSYGRNVLRCLHYAQRSVLWINCRLPLPQLLGGRSFFSKIVFPKNAFCVICCSLKC